MAGALSSLSDDDDDDASAAPTPAIAQETMSDRRVRGEHRPKSTPDDDDVGVSLADAARHSKTRR